MFSYDHQLALITGGSSGIGLALAKKLASQGAHVWILSRRQEILDAACQEISALRIHADQRVGTLKADVANREEVFAVLENFAHTVGTPDLLINNAGITYPGLFEDLPTEVFDQMMAVNYMGTVNVTKALLPGMIQRKSGQIALVSSGAGFLGLIGYSAYCGSKFAMRGLADVLRVELKPHNIKVSIIFPPDTQTPQLEFEKDLKPEITREVVGSNSRVYTAEAVAETIFQGLARGKYAIIPGFEPNLYFQLTNTFGLVYPLMDFVVSQARKKIASAKKDGHK